MQIDYRTQTVANIELKQLEEWNGRNMSGSTFSPFPELKRAVARYTRPRRGYNSLNEPVYLHCPTLLELQWLRHIKSSRWAALQNGEDSLQYYLQDMVRHGSCAVVKELCDYWCSDLDQVRANMSSVGAWDLARRGNAEIFKEFQHRGLISASAESIKILGIADLLREAIESEFPGRREPYPGQEERRVGDLDKYGGLKDARRNHPRMLWMTRCVVDWYNETADQPIAFASLYPALAMLKDEPLGHNNNPVLLEKLKELINSKHPRR